MAYTKPQIIAQNASSGTYAAGCPVNQDSRGAGYGDPSTNSGGRYQCQKCERTA